MALLNTYTWISTETIPGGGSLTVTHNVATRSGVPVAQHIVSITPVDAGGAGTYAPAATVLGDTIVLAKAGGGTVRLQIQAVHSVQQ